ncbi:MAG TPA: NAD(P)/FAD-dependent oxidoreductase [Microbacterium sp.]|nr:NAD(P)/FAD-dependent oxidoreductase [Microbacterium sp.]
MMMLKIVIIGAGYAGFYAAWKLEKRLRPGQAELTIIDPYPYMTYQPFLPEVAAGSIEGRHAAISLRRHLRRTHIVPGAVTAVCHERKSVGVRLESGADIEVDYDIVVITAGAITRTFPIAGVAENAIGLKHIEEAIAIRDRLLTAFDKASQLPPGPDRARLLTVTFVGGGFSGVEGLGEVLSLATSLVKRYPELSFAEINFHLVELNDRILPEVSDKPGEWVVRSLERRGAHVHLGTRVLSAADGDIVLSDGTRFASDLIVWTAGNGANPTVAKHTDLPVNERGLLEVRADLRIGNDSHFIPGAWAAGDNAFVPDLASNLPDAHTVPNAQHAVRQGKLLAANITRTLRGKVPSDYVHHNLGVVATLGLGRGIFQYRRVVIKGFPAWLLHRGYHVLAIPTWERKVRVLLVWISAALGGRDIVSLSATQTPRAAFVAAGEPLPVETLSRAAIAGH